MTIPFPKFPPGCSCGRTPCTCAPPSWAGAGLRLRECWKEIEQLKCLIAEIIKDMGGPVATGPIQGVVDGSDAAQGIVGEYVSGSGTLAYTANPGITTGPVMPIVIQPGDWDITSSLTCSSIYGAAFFILDPVPAGMSNSMIGGIIATTALAGVETDAVVIGRAARGSFKVPTLLPFRVTINQTPLAALPAGIATLAIEARRMR